MRILVVEDEEVLAQALVEALQGEFYAVDLAGDGETASEMVEVNSYDLIVLDWTIPPPTGIELLRTWRRAGPGHAGPDAHRPAAASTTRWTASTPGRTTS